MKPSLSTMITAVAVLGIGIIVYIFWNDISDWYSGFYNSASNGGGIYNDNQPVSLMDTLGNLAVPSTAFPEGETQGTSETYTGALSETVSHPIDTLKTLLGF